ncbi:Auxin response factor [Quillaja saponaria]|uniref:Auxin response factor n=1 Tax=Quillaja saponaria TaxID=32244 RepID=A0AAD7Q5B2_QUISA|nr:Auxin response factor [Quillaja saponaria]
MITVMDSVKWNPEKFLNSQLWHVCAGGMVQMPPINSKVFYFPQGHAEHAHGKVDFGNSRIPSFIPCRISAMSYMAEPDTDEVYVKMRLIPLEDKELDFQDDCFVGNNGVENQEKPASFAKTLTQSDANNGGGFSVPRYCAETIFPRLDYTAEPPVQTIIAKDVHGQCWKFRHIYRGTPRRHLLTTGWSNFVNQKKLVAGDSVVFLRAENGDLCIGIRRAKKGIGGGAVYSSGWNQAGGNCGGSLFGGYSAYLREEENTFVGKNFDGEMRGRVTAESVIEAVRLAVNGQPFEVIYHPRAGTPEFCVKASAVRASMQLQWSSGMRFKMPFETEDSSRISWFMGTISSVQVADPICCPDSPWRLLQVVWDEPDLLQNVKRVSPWLVELVSNMPTYHISPFSPPKKKPRFIQNHDFPPLNQLPMPSFSSNLLNHSSSLCNIENNISAGIQGARHTQFGQSSSDFHFTKLQSDLFQVGYPQVDHVALSSRHPGPTFMDSTNKNDNISCLLAVGNPGQSLKQHNETKAPHIVLFGQLILTEQQSSKSSSADTVGNSSSDGNSEKTMNFSDGIGTASTLHQNSSVENSSDGGSPWHKDHHKYDLGVETGHCKVFMESDDVGRTLDLSVLSSYDELYGKLSNMFGLTSSEVLSNVLYRDALGAIKHPGDKPFREFLKTARRLTILTDSSSSDNIGI